MSRYEMIDDFKKNMSSYVEEKLNNKNQELLFLYEHNGTMLNETELSVSLFLSQFEDVMAEVCFLKHLKAFIENEDYDRTIGPFNSVLKYPDGFFETARKLGYEHTFFKIYDSYMMTNIFERGMSGYDFFSAFEEVVADNSENKNGDER